MAGSTIGERNVSRFPDSETTGKSTICILCKILPDCPAVPSITYSRIGATLAGDCHMPAAVVCGSLLKLARTPGLFSAIPDMQLEYLPHRLPTSPSNMPRPAPETPTSPHGRCSRTTPHGSPAPHPRRWPVGPSPRRAGSGRSSTCGTPAHPCQTRICLCPRPRSRQ